MTYGAIALVMRGRRFLVIDTRGNVVFEKAASAIGTCHDGLMPCLVKNRWSYLDRSGETVFELRCSAAEEFSEGLAAILVKGRIGYINSTGSETVPPQFAQGDRFHEGMAVVEIFNAGPGKSDFAKPQQFGYIDRQGDMRIAPSLRVARRFSEGLAAVRLTETKTWSYVNSDGQFVIAEVTGGDQAGPFTGGLARIQSSSSEIGYINPQGEFVWPLQG
jgi:hypothetical protein